jgi:hypothetical protein
VRACVHPCVRACARACARACVCVCGCVCVSVCVIASVRACVHAYGLSFRSFCAPCAQLSRWRITCRQRRWANRLPATTSLPLTEKCLRLACSSVYASARTHATMRARTQAHVCTPLRRAHVRTHSREANATSRRRTLALVDVCAHTCDHADIRAFIPSGDLHVVIAFLQTRHRC